MTKLLSLLMAAAILILIDWYVFQGVKAAFHTFSPTFRKTVAVVYWLFTIVCVVALAVVSYRVQAFPATFRNFIMVGLFMNLLSKGLMVLFLLAEDLVRGGRALYEALATWSSSVPAPVAEAIPAEEGKTISRSQFLSQAGLLVASAPVVAMSYGILSGAHDYRVRRVTVRLPNLPAAFDGIRIGQLSDIHSGSFFNRVAVRGGVEMLMQEKPDLVFFTGDLVNNVADEVKEYISIFDEVKAPLGVYSVLGNHDYGDYVLWPSAQAKRQNLADLKEAHRLMGWQLLNNENTILRQGGEQLAVVGVENWSAIGRFPRHGNLEQALKGTEEAAVRLLLSHDPTHWDAQVRPEFPQVDVMFAGHTHGMQFGIEVGNFKWSPAQLMYRQWAGLYQQEQQYLYVNRGFGFIGFPGRIGILPEITIMELKRA